MCYGTVDWLIDWESIFCQFCNNRKYSFFAFPLFVFRAKVEIEEQKSFSSRKLGELHWKNHARHPKKPQQITVGAKPRPKMPASKFRPIRGAEESKFTHSRSTTATQTVMQDWIDSGKGGEMKQRLAWNRGKSCRQAYQPISGLCHTLLAIVTPLFHAKRCHVHLPSFVLISEW